jgi:predicted glycoside hydrolase/deacetylase ChbG (UPF0249 family)
MNMFVSAPKCIVNADDYGRSKGISKGIREAHLHGIVSSTTVMMNFENAQKEVQLARQECQDLRIGVHLNVTAGLPLSDPKDIPALLGSEGQFNTPEHVMNSLTALPIDQVEREWRQQIEALLELDVEIDHLDSHHHVAAANERLWALHLALAQEHHIGVRLPYPTDDDESALVSNFAAPLRRFASENALATLQTVSIPRTQALFTSFFAESATLATLLSLLEEATAYSSSEIMCHPGYVDDEISPSSYSSHRQVELEILTSDQVKSAIDTHALELTGFIEL